MSLCPIIIFRACVVSRNQQGGQGYHLDRFRSGSPGLHAYNNPTLSASPYSTLPRRMASHGQATSIQSPTRVGRLGPQNSLEMSCPPDFYGTMGRNNSFKQQRNNTLPSTGGQQTVCFSAGSASSAMAAKARLITARTPLLEDDRESCV